MRKVIVNSTPLIALCKAGELLLLRRMYGEIKIPEAVYLIFAIFSKYNW